MTGMTIEWAPFTLAEGTTEEALLEAAEALQTEFLALQDGFVKRELIRGEDGRWCDLVYWRDAESAAKAMPAAMGSPVCNRYFSLMVHPDPSVGVSHFVVRRAYP